jgi:hypothetical protein
MEWVVVTKGSSPTASVDGTYTKDETDQSNPIYLNANKLAKIEFDSLNRNYRLYTRTSTTGHWAPIIRLVGTEPAYTGTYLDGSTVVLGFTATLVRSIVVPHGPSAASSPGRVLECQIGSDIATSYTFLDTTDPCESPLLPTEYCKAKACDSDAGGSFRKKKTCTNGRLVDDTSDKASCTLVAPNTPQTSGAAVTAIAAAQPPAADASRTTLPCAELARLVGPNDASIVVCASTGTSSSVIINGSDLRLTVSLYKRDSGDWGGYQTIGTQTGGTVQVGSAKGLYVMIDNTGKTVTFVLHYHGVHNGSPPEKSVYDVSTTGTSNGAYTLTRKLPTGTGAEQTYSVTVVSSNPDPFYVTPADSHSQTTIACKELKDLPSSPALSTEDKPSSCSSSDSGVDVTVKRGTDTLRVTLYERTAKWEGYGIVTPATAGLKGGYVYVSTPLQAPLSVTCVWHERDGGYIKGVYTANLTGLSGTLYTYKLITTQATDAVVTMEVPKGTAGPFQPTQAQIDAENSRSEACVLLNSKISTVRCDQTGPPTTVSITRGAEALVYVSLYQDSFGSWAGYGLNGLSVLPQTGQVPPTNGVYVSIGGMGVKCVWDSGASATQSIVEYDATQAGVGSSTYNLVPVITTTAQVDTTVVVVSGTSPFTSVLSSSSGWKPSTEEIIGIVAGAVGLIILIAVVVLILKRNRNKRIEPKPL